MLHLAPCAASQKQHMNILVGDVGRMSGICMFLLVVNPSRTSVRFSHLTCTLNTLSIWSKTKQTFLARIYFKHIQTFVKLWLLLRTASKISGVSGMPAVPVQIQRSNFLTLRVPLLGPCALRVPFQQRGSCSSSRSSNYDFCCIYSYISHHQVFLSIRLYS